MHERKIIFEVYDEIDKIALILNLSKKEATDIFFAHKVS